MFQLSIFQGVYKHQASASPGGFCVAPPNFEALKQMI